MPQETGPRAAPGTRGGTGLTARVRRTRSQAGGDAHGRFVLDVDLDLAPGITILFGPSGAGKSTTLALIAGLLRPDAGRVTAGDEVWFDDASGIDVPVHRRRLAFVFQSLALFPHMTAAANVAYGMPRDVSADEARARAVALLSRFKVGALADRKPSTFSGGESQRVALARAFATAPRVALFDEPFSALERDLRTELMAEVRAFVDEAAIPLVHVTHDRREACALGDRVLVLEAGRIVRQGEADEVLT